MRNFELRRRKECKTFDTEAASKLRLPKQHLPTDKDCGASYRGMKENSKHIPNKIEQNCNNQKSSLNDLRWRCGRWPQRTWTNTREKVARIARICMPKHFKRRSNVNPENLSHELTDSRKGHTVWGCSGRTFIVVRIH